MRIDVFVQEKQMFCLQKSVPSSWRMNIYRMDFQSNQKGKKRIIHFQCALSTFQSIQLIRTSFNKQDLHA